MSDPDVSGAKGVWTQHTVDGPGAPSVVRWYELVPSLCNGTTCPAAALKQAGTVSDATHFVFNAAISPTGNGQDAVIHYNLGSGSLLPQIRARWHAADMPAGATAGDILIGSSVAAAQDFSCNPGPCRWGDYAGATPDPTRDDTVWGSNQLLGSPSGSNPRWTTRNFAIQVLSGYVAAGGRHATAGLAGTRLRRVLGVQPHSRTAARLRLLRPAAADLDAAHGRHPRCERSGGAGARRGATRGRAGRPCYAGRRGRCQRPAERHGRAPPGHARRLRRRASGGARRAPDGRGQRRLAGRGCDRVRPVVPRSPCRACPPAERPVPPAPWRPASTQSCRAPPRKASARSGRSTKSRCSTAGPMASRRPPRTRCLPSRACSSPEDIQR